MNFKEYGDNNKDTIMLLHGGGLSWWNYREEAEKLKNSYHIILPILDGHSESDRSFTSIEDNAQEIIDYIKEEQKNGAYLILITMREKEELAQAVTWCVKQGINFDAVNDNLPHMKRFFKNNPRKIFCNEYLDDTNIGGIEHILEEIKKGRK